MAKHTSGPWKVISYEGHNFPKGGDFVGEIRGTKGKKVYNGAFSFHAIKNLANARLIASAPELLEACKNLIYSFNTMDSQDIGVSIRLGKQAIFKAEGGK